MKARFRDRTEAGRQLATLLAAYAGRDDVLVLGLPRGGVPVAYQVAGALRCPLDVFVVRKLGVPGHEELAMGAIAMDGVRVLNQDVIDRLGIRPDVIESVTEQARAVVEHRVSAYRGSRPLPSISGRSVILVDDGLATGATMKAAVAAVRRQEPTTVVVAVPVAASVTCRELARPGLADDVVCCLTPHPFYAVGSVYDDFTQTPDDEVRRLLTEAPPPSS